MIVRRSTNARLQSDFYRDQYRRMIRWLMVSTVIIFILLFSIIYSIVSQPERKYYGNTMDGQILDMPVAIRANE